MDLWARSGCCTLPGKNPVASASRRRGDQDLEDVDAVPLHERHALPGLVVHNLAPRVPKGTPFPTRASVETASRGRLTAAAWKAM